MEQECCREEVMGASLSAPRPVNGLRDMSETSAVLH